MLRFSVDDTSEDSNLIKDYVPTGPEQIWVSDITCLCARNGFVYLSLVTDQYSRQIMGYHVFATLEVFGPLKALRMALRNRSHRGSRLIHHSDRGIQYCCKEYIKLLKSNGIVTSMSAKGSPHENAVAERVNGVLKSEFYLDRGFDDYDQVRRVVLETIGIYNSQRPHASCDYLTPREAHARNGVLRKRWSVYKRRNTQHDLQPIGEEVKMVLAQLTLRTCAEVST